MFKPGKFEDVICKNCGKKCRTELKAELCSIPCILEWREEEKYHELELAKKKEKLSLVGSGGGEKK